MSELQTPTGALGDNPSGIGTAILGNSYDPTESNLKALEISDKWFGQYQEQQKAKTALSAKLISNLNPDYNDVMPQDISRVGGFRDQAQEIQNLAQKGVREKFALNDPRNPYFQQIQNKQQDLLSQIAMSKVQKANVFAQVNKFNPDKHDLDAYNQWLFAQQMAAGPVERSKLPLSGITDKISPLSTIFANYAKTLKPDSGGENMWYENTPAGQTVIHKVAENITSSQAKEWGHLIALQPHQSEQLGVELDKLRQTAPDRHKALLEPYLTPGNEQNPSLSITDAESLAKGDLAAQMFMNQYHHYKDDIKVQDSPYEKEKIAAIRAQGGAKSKAQDEGEAELSMMQDLFARGTEGTGIVGLKDRNLGKFKGMLTKTSTSFDDLIDPHHQFPKTTTTQEPGESDNYITGIKTSADGLSNDPTGYGVDIKTSDLGDHWKHFSPYDFKSALAYINQKKSEKTYSESYMAGRKDGTIDSKGQVNSKALLNKFGVKPPAPAATTAPDAYTGVTTGKDAITGKAIKIGVKNGKWYNTETGEEIK